MRNNRRDFIRMATIGTVGLTALPRVSTSKESSQPPRRFIIDSHQHYDPASDYVDKLVRIYQPRNAMACVLTPMTGFDVIRRAASAHPDVIIPYGDVSVDNPQVLTEIQKFFDAGFKGIKMHRPKNNWDDVGYFPIYEKLQSLRLVALFHTGIVNGSNDQPEVSSMARMRPSFLHTISRSFPQLVIQGAHLGNPWYDEAAEVARWRKNVYFDLTGSSLIKKAKNLCCLQGVPLVGRADGSQLAGRSLCLREAGLRYRRGAGESRRLPRALRGHAQCLWSARAKPEEDLWRDSRRNPWGQSPGVKWPSTVGQ